ncbi:MAG: DUF1844 domain-containing protein [bacterium]|nr:DUF1844 domain-containing protein [bacterium]
MSENNRDYEKAKEEKSKQSIPPQDVQFLNIVFMFSSAAFQHLGEMPDPISNEKKIDLNAAKYSIDVIDVLAKKSKGNLTEHESKIMDDILYNLRLKYLEVCKKEKKEG